MDYNFDFEINCDLDDEKESVSCWEKGWQWFKKKPLILKIIIGFLGVVFLIAILFLIGLGVSKIWNLFTGNHKNSISNSNICDNGSSPKNINNVNDYNLSNEKKDCVENDFESSTDSDNPVSVVNNDLVNDADNLEVDALEFFPWKQFKNIIYSVNSLKDFAKKKGYLTDDNTVTDIGKKYLCKKSSITKGDYWAVTEEFVSEYTEDLEERRKEINDILNHKG